jgi:hypothetical protein
VTLDPGKEVRHGPVIRHAGVLVADGGGEEFQEAAGGGVAGVGDDRRHRHAGADRSDRFLRSDGRQLIHGFSAT